MTRDGMVFYRSFYESVIALPEDMQLEAVKAIIEYGLDGKEPVGQGIAKAMYMMAKPQIDANNKRYQNGVKGGRPARDEGSSAETREEPSNNRNVTGKEPIKNQTGTEPEPKEKDKEKEKDNKKSISDEIPEKTDAFSAQFATIRELYNSVCGSYPRLVKLSDARKRAIRARLRSGYTIEDFKRLFELAETSDFLKGKNNRNWSATFDWLIADSNMAKVLDGNYSVTRTIPPDPPRTTNRFHNFEERKTDYDAMMMEEWER